MECWNWEEIDPISTTACVAVDKLYCWSHCFTSKTCQKERKGWGGKYSVVYIATTAGTRGHRQNDCHNLCHYDEGSWCHAYGPNENQLLIVDGSKKALSNPSPETKCAVLMSYMGTVQVHVAGVWCERLHYLHPGMSSNVVSNSGVCYSLCSIFGRGVFLLFLTIDTWTFLLWYKKGKDKEV